LIGLLCSYAVNVLKNVSGHRQRREAHTLQYYSLKVLDAERVKAEKMHLKYSSVINTINSLHHRNTNNRLTPPFTKHHIPVRSKT
jgi:hypothetical protein